MAMVRAIVLVEESIRRRSVVSGMISIIVVFTMVLYPLIRRFAVALARRSGTRKVTLTEWTAMRQIIMRWRWTMMRIMLMSLVVSWIVTPLVIMVLMRVSHACRVLRLIMSKIVLLPSVFSLRIQAACHAIGIIRSFRHSIFGSSGRWVTISWRMTRRLPSTTSGEDQSMLGLECKPLCAINPIFH
jgi:hypothetical protein